MTETLLIGNYPAYFIIWNLFLLLIPYFLYVILRRLEIRTGLKSIYNKLVALFIGFCWLLFIPNTAYVMVDVRHVSVLCNDLVYKNCIDNIWQILFFFTYGLIGWLAYIYILCKIKDLVKKIFSSRVSEIFIIILIPIISLGVLLGLIERWNSWQIFISPLRVSRDAAQYFLDIYYFENYLLFTVFLYILYYIGDYVYAKISNKSC